MNGNQTVRTSSEMKKAHVVKIPDELINRLKPFGARFIKVSKPVLGQSRTGKAAVEYGYLLAPYDASDPQLLGWMEAGGNYGVVFGRGVYGLDIDDPEVQTLFEAEVRTFTVRSGGGEGKHYYILGDLTENGTILDGGRNLGNVQVKNKHVVGPGCGHHSGGRYEIIEDLPLAWVTVEQLNEIFSERLKWSGDSRAREEADAEETGRFIDAHIPMEEIVDIGGFSRLTADEWQGEHPVHGSTTGQNLSVNVAKNVWHCFRCNSGGGPLQWLAVREGLMKCHEVKPGVMKGELFHRAIDIARRLGYDIARMEGEEDLPARAKKYFKGRTFIPSRLAEELMRETHIRIIPGPTIFVYDPERGYYSRDGETALKRLIYAKLGGAHRVNRSNETLAIIQIQTMSGEVPVIPDKIAVENGLLNVLTGELDPFTPEVFVTSKLPVRWDPGADQSVVRTFISQVVDDEDRRTLQEFTGYCLYKAYPFHKALMLVGDGANGKSTFISMVSAMLGGRENVSNKSLQALETDRFAAAQLHGKLANFAADISRDALKSTGMFKSLTGGDVIDAEKKFRDSFSFPNYAKMEFSCNEIPRVRNDDTTAFFRRWIVVMFPRAFKGDDCDPFLLDKLTTPEALSGVLAWAIEGLQALMERGGFLESKSTAETRERYIKLSDPAKHFIETFLEDAPEGVVHKANLYRGFVAWSKEEGLRVASKSVFNARIPEQFEAAQVKNVRLGGKKTWCWVGVGFSEAVRGVRYLADLYLRRILEEENSKIISNTDEAQNRVTRTGPGGNWLDEHRKKGGQAE